MSYRASSLFWSDCACMQMFGTLPSSEKGASPVRHLKLEEEEGSENMYSQKVL